MSFFPGRDPAVGDAFQCDAIERIIVPRSIDLGDFAVRRALPSEQSRMVGPFIFFDHFGPVEFRSGGGLDVRPHPHIGLATVTYLFDGEIVHRDSLGTMAPIRPGEVNWMVAGRGIVHSERTGTERRGAGDHLHGLQCWVALPSAREEIEPSFAHYPAEAFPTVSGDGKNVRIAIGSLYGTRSAVETTSETVLAEAMLTAGATLPLDNDHEERGIYVVAGEIDITGDRFGPQQLLVFRPGDRITIRALKEAHIIVLGGAAMDGPRHIWWNFVSSRKERIEQAKAEWKAGRFSIVPGDETEFIPLPEDR
jgi:redox-sensitive bicupin YhaK (pirin superfamily)